MKTILVIDDESDIIDGLKARLSREGFEVLGAATAEEGIAAVDRDEPDLVVLDVMLPDVDGFEVCRRIRERSRDLPIVMLSAKSDEVDKVVGLEIGADDYVTKPFSARELLARIRARLRSRTAEPVANAARQRIGSVEVDLEALWATRDGRPLSLTPKEYGILRMLLERRGEVVSRTRLLTEVWGYSEEATTRTVDTHILNLRQKVEDDPANPRRIQTVYGHGYRLV